MKNSRIYIMLFLIVLVFFLVRFFSISLDYPYFFSWDMDLTVSIDSLLLQSGVLPDHINHPGFGLYLLVFFAQKVGHLFNQLSVLTLNDLQSSLNPLLVMAEHTDFIRRFSPIVAILTSLFLTIGVLLCYSKNYYRILPFCFLFFASQQSLLYHSALIRTDFYAYFLWVLAFFFVCLASETRSTKSRVFYLFMVGIFCGLSLLTKIQVLIYLFSLVPLLWLIESRTFSRLYGKKHVILVLAVSLLNFAALFYLVLASRGVVIPEGMAVFASNYSVSTITKILFLVQGLLLIIQIILWKREWFSRRHIQAFISYPTAILFGFYFSFLFHFLLFNLPHPLTYLLYDAKMIFNRSSYQDIGKFSSYLGQLSQMFSLVGTINAQTIFLVFLILSLVLLRIFALVKIPWSKIIAAAMALVLIGLNFCLGTRPVLRDLLWTEQLPCVLIVIILLEIMERLDIRGKRVAVFGVMTILCVLSVHNLSEGAKIKLKLNANFNRYGWIETKWLEPVYSYNQSKYKEVVSRIFDNPLSLDNIKSLNYQNHVAIKNAASFVFPNQDITLKNITGIDYGQPVWQGKINLRIKDFSQNLRHAILVSNQNLPYKNIRFVAKDVNEPSENPDKLREDSGDSSLTILPRNGLRVLLFFPKSYAVQTNCPLKQTSEKIVIKDEKNEYEMIGQEIPNYCEITGSSLMVEHFFVID